MDVDTSFVPQPGVGHPRLFGRIEISSYCRYSAWYLLIAVVLSCHNSLAIVMIFTFDTKSIPYWL